MYNGQKQQHKKQNGDLEVYCCQGLTLYVKWYII